MEKDEEDKLQEMMQRAMMGDFTPTATIGYGLLPIPTSNFPSPNVQFPQILAPGVQE